MGLSMSNARNPSAVVRPLALNNWAMVTSASGNPTSLVASDSSDLLTMGSG